MKGCGCSCLKLSMYNNELLEKENTSWISLDKYGFRETCATAVLTCGPLDVLMDQGLSQSAIH